MTRFTEWDKYCDSEDYDVDELALKEYEYFLKERYDEYKLMIDDYSDWNEL